MELKEILMLTLPVSISFGISMSACALYIGIPLYWIAKSLKKIEKPFDERGDDGA